MASSPLGPGPHNSLIPHPPPPILKVSISVVPRNPLSVPECYGEPIYMVSAKKFGGLVDGLGISDLDGTVY